MADEIIAQQKAAHTPGPWAVHLHNGTAINGAAIVSATSGARVVSIPRVADRPTDTKEADARLIAAAPEMLSALKATVRVLDAHPSHWVERRVVLDAIAKAEGR